MAHEMTKEEAIILLKRYQKTQCLKPSRKLFGWRLNHEFIRSVYEEWLIPELIRRIEASAHSPIDVIRTFYYEMDDILCNSEQGITWSYASTMENCAGEILRYLRGKEENEDVIR